ncbi:MAG: biopolymer transporter ExbD [Bacteroidales bacterium]|nr:biopolymer transporter ExbD [Bacteroidales bacterium]
MARFTGKKAKETPGLNMGSMSDIIFMLLFFFMVITSMRENTLVVTNVPKGTEVAKLDDPSNSCTVYIGVPEDKQRYGQKTRIQVNDQLSKKEDIIPFIEMQRSQHSRIMEDGSNAADQLTTIIKADEKVPMGIITDVKGELREAGALRIFYNAAEDTKRLHQQKK